MACSSSEESEDDDDEEAQKKFEAYRKKLLGGLNGPENGDISNVYRKRDLQDDENPEELDIKFNVGFGEDIGKKILEEK